MPDYFYRAVDRAGSPIRGTITSPSPAALEAKLAEAGSVLVEILNPEDEGLGQTKITIFKPNVKARELIDFLVTLRGLVKAGVTLLDALNTIGKEVENPYFKDALKDIVSSVEGGNQFNAALGSHPRIFSEHFVGMVKAGELSGNMPETFGELIRHLENQEALKADVKQATLYPVAVLIALGLFITVLFTFVVPKFITLLTSLNVPLPMPTRIVMGLSDFFMASWWVLALFGGLTPVLYKYATRRWEGFAFAVDNMKMNVAVFGELNRMLAISKFAYNFSALFKSGVPILQTLELCEPIMKNKVMELALREARTDIAGGMQLHESLKKHDVFSSKALMMITVGESSGDLGGALENLANYYNEDVPRRMKKIFGIMEPAIMLFLIGIVGFTAVSIILPILSLFGSIK